MNDSIIIQLVSFSLDILLKTTQQFCIGYVGKFAIRLQVSNFFQCLQHKNKIMECLNLHLQPLRRKPRFLLNVS